MEKLARSGLGLPHVRDRPKRFFPLLQDQKLLENQKQKLLPDTEAPVHAGVKTGAPVVTESHHSYFGLQKL